MQTSKEHDFLVKGLIDHFLKNGLEIYYADYTGYDKPKVIKRHSPDIMAKDRSNGMVYIGLVKSCGEFSDQITKEEFEDFPKRLLKTQNSEKIRVPFYIGVPEKCQTKVKESFESFGIPWKENIQVVGLKQNWKISWTPKPGKFNSTKISFVKF